PLVVTLTGAKLEVQNGWLSLMGVLEADGLFYEDPMSGISFKAEQVALHTVPWSFITEGVPRIDELELKRANLRIVLRPRATTEPAREQDKGPVSTIRQIPVAVEHAKFEDVTVAVEQGNRRVTGQVTAVLEKLGPARKGNITFQTAFLLKREGAT